MRIPIPAHRLFCVSDKQALLSYLLFAGFSYQRRQSSESPGVRWTASGNNIRRLSDNIKTEYIVFEIRTVMCFKWMGCSSNDSWTIHIKLLLYLIFYIALRICLWKVRFLLEWNARTHDTKDMYIQTDYLSSWFKFILSQWKMQKNLIVTTQEV